MNFLHIKTRRRKVKVRIFSALLLLFGSALPAVGWAPARKSEDPNLLQSRAIETVESVRSNYYRTGKLGSMKAAHADLEASYKTFIARGDVAAAALSLLTMADIERATHLGLTKEQASAAEKYRKAIELSKQANRTDYEFKALAGLAQAEWNQYNVASALQHISEAGELASASGNLSFILRALDELGGFAADRNLDTARSSLELAQTVAAKLPISHEHYVHQMDLGELYYRLALGCDSFAKPQECSQLFDRARSAFETGGTIARSLQYDYLAELSKGLLEDVDRQRVLNAQQLAYGARIAQNNGSTEVAETSLRQAIAIQENSPKPDDPALVDSLVALAGLLVTSNKIDEAIGIYHHALEITRKDQDLHREAQILSSLAQADLKLAKYDEATEYLQEAARIQDVLQDTGALATTLSNLGSVYEAKGEYDRAQINYEKSFELRERAFGAHSAVTASSLTDLGGLYYHMGRLSEAQSAYEKALSALESTLGKDQTEVGTVMNNLGLVYQALGRYAEAEAALSRALNIRKKVLGEEHPDTAATLNNLAFLDVDLGKLDEASRLFEEALAIDSKALGANHPTTKTVADNLAEVKNMQKENSGPNKQN